MAAVAWVCLGERSWGFPKSTQIGVHLGPWTDLGSPILSYGAWCRTGLPLEWMWSLVTGKSSVSLLASNSELKEVLEIT